MATRVTSAFQQFFGPLGITACDLRIVTPYTLEMLNALLVSHNADLPGLHNCIPLVITPKSALTSTAQKDDITASATPYLSISGPERQSCPHRVHIRTRTPPEVALAPMDGYCGWYTDLVSHNARKHIRHHRVVAVHRNVASPVLNPSWGSCINCRVAENSNLRR